LKKVKATLADAKADAKKLAAGPLPGQSDLDVKPHPRLPNTYTVPFLGGHLVYAVFEGDEEGLVGILHHER
ncbi:MAG: hypothetical protein ACJ77H_17125, partial [Actinomycetota bacterium]